jgi:hypothetical protein
VRKTKLALTKTKVNGRRYYCVTSPKLGPGRRRRFFKDKAEAETFMRLAQVQQENYGTAALSFSDALRVETIECSELLQPYGKTLRDATKFYLAHLKAVTGSRKVCEVVADLLAARAADGMSTRYLGDLRARLGRFVNSFGEEMIASINARQIDEWLRGLGVGAVTRNTFRRRLAVLFSFAKRRGYVTENPVADVERAKERETEVQILSVSETARLLEGADSEMLPFWTIGAFAGLRRAEIERLAWNEVDFEAGVIEVKASKSKTASRRRSQCSQICANGLNLTAHAPDPCAPLICSKRLTRTGNAPGCASSGRTTGCDTASARIISLGLTTQPSWRSKWATRPR